MAGLWFVTLWHLVSAVRFNSAAARPRSAMGDGQSVHHGVHSS